ncbi:MAG: aminoacyl-histidine dipeptidase [Candidatus Zhuqueibacterota bacterium]
MKFDHAPTNEILKWFEEITRIPRCSKNEEKIAAWLMDWAKKNGFEARMDKVKNIVIKIPPSAGFEKSPIVVIQGHMDMVCEKTPDSTHDFTKDPIKLVYEGEWLTADRTTLGADNGIAIAMALAMAMDKTVKHPPLELLFTVDEETGLTGANALEPGFIEGKILINVDSEDEGVFTVGCAGGVNTRSILPLNFEELPVGYKAYKLTSSGMKGGHSGIDIAKGKANAIQILGRTLHAILNENVDARIANVKGGSAHNAIPRDAEAVVFLAEAEAAKAANTVTKASTLFLDEFKTTDPDLKATIAPASGKFNKALTAKDTRRVVDFILAMPHGVAAMSPHIPGLVETSNNFAKISIEDNALNVLTSQRSSVISRLKAHTAKIEAVAKLAGGDAKTSEGYPPWQPNMDSPLLARSVKLYESMFHKKPVVEVIHAGLECGIIGDKNPGMDMISLGPDLKYPHSPDEKIHIGAIGKVWDFLVALLATMK